MLYFVPQKGKQTYVYASTFVYFGNYTCVRLRARIVGEIVAFSSPVPVVGLKTTTKGDEIQNLIVCKFISFERSI